MISLIGRTSSNWLFILSVALLRIIPLCAIPAENFPSYPGPVANPHFIKQHDSLLIQLNLEYLNGVNNHQIPFELIPIIEKILELDPTQYTHWFNLGQENIKIHEYNDAIEAFQRGLEMFPSRENFSLLRIYVCMSFCYHETGNHKLEKNILKIASGINPDHPEVIGRNAICAHSRLRYSKAEHYHEQLVNVLRSQGINESDIAFYLGRLYMSTDHLEAEKHLRIACQYDQDNLKKQAALAWALIRNPLKIDEGMKLIGQMIRTDPGNAILLHQQGYGYYLKGNYNEALLTLHNAEELYQKYSYELYNHISMVEEAIAQLEK